MPVDFSVTNQLASPAIYASSFATRPAASFKGRLFVDTDNPSSGIYRDTGTAWIAIAGTSVGEIQSLNDVCVVGNTTTYLGIEIYGQSAFGENISPPYGRMTPFGDYALTIGNNSEFQSSLYVQDRSFFNTTVGINTSLTTPLLIGGDTTTSTLTYRTTSAAGITGARHIFQVGNNGATEAMTILNNANVGIATASPIYKLDLNGTFRAIGASTFSNDVAIGKTTTYQAKLDVVATSGAAYAASNSNLDQLLIGSAERGVSSFFGLTTGSTYILGLGNGISPQMGIGTFGSADLIFATNNTERMRIFSNGNIAINSTTDAGYKLDVNGTGRFVNGVNIATTSGSVGIGTTSPRAKISVISGTDNTGTFFPATDALIVGINNNIASNSPNLAISTNTVAGIDVGGSIGFGGLFLGPGDLRDVGFGMIKGAKENSTLGNAQGYLSFSTYGIGGMIEKFKISSTGAASFTSSVSIGNFTTVQKNALTAVAGMVVYDTTLNKLCVYTTVWETITSI